MPKANPTSQAQGRYTFGSGARPLDGYTIKRAIGRGGFGEVYYATSDSGKEVALKLILRNLDVERRGVMQCMNLKCPNLLTIFDMKTSDAGDTFVVMEYVAGPSLASVLRQYPGGLPLAEVRHWLKGLVEGVAYLHDHGIVHRDLKPANLFMEEGIVKIGDYGLAKLITPSQGTEHSESIGTCHYMAPEIGSGKYNKPIDVYAIGSHPLRDAHRPGAVRGRDGQRGADEALDGAARRIDARRALQGDRGQRHWPRTPTSVPAGSTTCCPRRMLPGPPRSGSSATASGAPLRRGPARQGRARQGLRSGRRAADRGRGADFLHRAGYASARDPGMPEGSESGSGPTGRPFSVRPVPGGRRRRPIHRPPRRGRPQRQWRGSQVPRLVLTSATAAPPRAAPPAGAARVAQRPRPHRRARLLDALGRPACGALDRPRRRASWASIHRPIPSNWRISTVWHSWEPGRS